MCLSEHAFSFEIVCVHEFYLLQFTHSVVSDSLWPHESQHTRPPCPSPTPRVHPNPCPLSRWCHPTVSSSVIPFSSCPQSPQASGSFPVSQLFIWGGQSIGVSALASILPMNTQEWSPSEWTGFICLVNSLKVLRSKSYLSCVRILRYDRKSHSFHWDWLVKIYPIPRLLV